MHSYIFVAKAHVTKCAPKVCLTWRKKQHISILYNPCFCLVVCFNRFCFSSFNVTRKKYERRERERTSETWKENDDINNQGFNEKNNKNIYNVLRDTFSSVYILITTLMYCDVLHCMEGYMCVCAIIFFIC